MRKRDFVTYSGVPASSPQRDWRSLQVHSILASVPRGLHLLRDTQWRQHGQYAHGWRIRGWPPNVCRDRL